MIERSETIHLAWGESRAASVRDALRLLGCEARVIALSKALSVGPIHPPDPPGRRAWLSANLRTDEPDADWIEPETPWTEATADYVHPVYWVCLSDAVEHASFLEFVFRMAGRPFDVVDATRIDFTALGGPSPFFSLGQLRPEAIAASGLYRRRRPFSRAESDAAAAVWSRLRRENASLRVVRDGRLVSAPLTHFDAVLTRQAARDWELLVKLIARVLHHLTVEADPPGQGCGDELLFARVLALGQSGALEIAGSGPGLRDYEVRLPMPTATGP